MAHKSTLIIASMMRLSPTPDEIASRAATIGITFASLCERANVSLSAFYRWRRGELPNLGRYQRLVRALEEAENETLLKTLNNKRIAEMAGSP